jgi:hypothetical protein
MPSAWALNVAFGGGHIAYPRGFVSRMPAVLLLLLGLGWRVAQTLGTDRVVPAHSTALTLPATFKHHLFLRLRHLRATLCWRGKRCCAYVYFATRYAFTHSLTPLPPCACPLYPVPASCGLRRSTAAAWWDKTRTNVRPAWRLRFFFFWAFIAGNAARWRWLSAKA